MKNFLKRAATAYYKGEPIIEDSHFDYLADKYGFDDLGAQEGDVKHLYQMYSLRKIYDDENKDTGLTGPTVVTPKLDGSSLAIVYDKGYLVSGTTRGDGIIGKNCTHNILAHPNITKMIPTINAIQIIGEIVIPKKVKNARNKAAGALNLKDSIEFVSRDTTFIAYGIKGYSGNDTYLEDMKMLKTWGFNVVTESNWKQFPQDGSVFRLDNNAEFETLGYTSKHPRASFALKQRDEEPLAETTLRRVEWQVGKGGRVTPVAHFDTVIIDDANISKATLNNPGFIEELKLDIGDRVLVRRAGKIIPQIVAKV